MKKQTKQITNADVIDNHLILSLLNANEPKIWRMSLDEIGAASFELKKNAQSEITKLILKPTKGTAQIIAEFANQDIALEALTRASDALQNQSSSATKKSRPKNSKPKASLPQEKNTHQWGLAFIGVIVVIILYYYLTTLMPTKNTEFGPSTTNTPPTSSPQNTTGVPISADDFLNGL